MELNKQDLQRLIRSGDDSIQLRSKPPRLGFYYIVSHGVFQNGWIYCSICDKLLNVVSRMSSNLSRHSRSKLHTKLLKLSQERHALWNTRTRIIVNEAPTQAIEERPPIIAKPIGIKGDHQSLHKITSHQSMLNNELCNREDN